LETLRGSPALDAIRTAHRRGAVIAGTSAGTAVLGDIAIAGDGPGDPLRPGAPPPPLAAGLGFVAGVIFDQHFLARRRHDRLVAALLASPGKTGVGVDEGAAVLCRPDGSLEVLGASLVSVYLPGPAG